MSWERKQPKRETTLVRLTRQTKAMEQLAANHNRAVDKECCKLQQKIEQLTKSRDSKSQQLFALRDILDKMALLNLDTR